MAALGVAGHLSATELGRRYRAARDRVERGHLQVVWLLVQGRSRSEVARIMGLSGLWVAEIVRRYDVKGPDGLGDRRRGDAGARPLLGAEGEAALRVALAEPPSDGGPWTGPKVAAWMAARLGREVWPQRGRDYLKKLGYSRQVPRPRHAEAAGPEERAAYKKSSPRPWTSTARSTPTARSRCGRSTSTGSGRSRSCAGSGRPKGSGRSRTPATSGSTRN